MEPEREDIDEEDQWEDIDEEDESDGSHGHGDDDDDDDDDFEDEDFSSFPLIAAARDDDLMAVRSLLEQEGVDKNGTSKLGCSALWYAAENGNSAIVQLLLSQGVYQEIDNQSASVLRQRKKTKQPTPLWIASCAGHLSVIQLLVEHGGADIEEGHDTNGQSPLFIACRANHLNIVRFLLEQGADRDKANNDGCTPLHCAARKGYVDIAKLLMVYGADLEARDNFGQLPVDRAITEEITDLSARIRRGRLPIDNATSEKMKQAIRDEPRRRLNHGFKRTTEQDRHPDAATSAFTEQEEDNDVRDQRSCLEEGAAQQEGSIADEDQDSEPSDDEDD